MAHPTDYRYINDEKTGEVGYEITYNIDGISQKCRIIYKSIEKNRIGVYQTRTNCPTGIHSFFSAKDELEAGNALQHMLEEALVEIRMAK